MPTNDVWNEPYGANSSCSASLQGQERWQQIFLYTIFVVWNRFIAIIITKKTTDFQIPVLLVDAAAKVSCCQEPSKLGLAWMFSLFNQEGQSATIGATLARAMPGVWKLNLWYY